MAVLEFVGVDLVGVLSIIGAIYIAYLTARTPKKITPTEQRAAQVDLATRAEQFAAGSLTTVEKWTKQITDLHDDMGQMRDEVDRVRGELSAMKTDLARVTVERDDLKRENTALHGKVTQLEARVRSLEHPA